ncbi:MAG: class I SAM-dependent RNA methyltransferase [Bacillota bacterium]
MKIIVTSGFGIETATKLELRSLGIDAPSERGRFYFDGTVDDVINCNLHLRAAGKVYVELAKFEASTFDDLFDGVHQLNWADIIPQNGVIIVNAKSIDSTLFAVSSLQSVSKKAIVKKLCEKYRSLPEDGIAVKIEISIVNDICSVLLDTTGDGLHKRGYRDMVWEAPIKETIAAAIVKLSVWNPERPMIDAFTGSGTIPIECAMVALNMAPGLKRKFLLEENSLAFDPSLMANAKRQAEEAINWDAKPRIAGFDIDKRAIRLAQHHAENFGLSKYIHFEVNDMRNISSRYKYGVIISNPPYGERLMGNEDLAELYRDFGRMFRSLDCWSLYAITSYQGFERAFGMWATKNRKIYNAKLECRLYQYLGERPPRRPYGSNEELQTKDE